MLRCMVFFAGDRIANVDPLGDIVALLGLAAFFQCDQTQPRQIGYVLKQSNFYTSWYRYRQQEITKFSIPVIPFSCLTGPGNYYYFLFLYAIKSLPRS